MVSTQRRPQLGRRERAYHPRAELFLEIQTLQQSGGKGLLTPVIQQQLAIAFATTAAKGATMANCCPVPPLRRGARPRCILLAWQFSVVVPFQRPLESETSVREKLLYLPLQRYQNRRVLHEQETGAIYHWQSSLGYKHPFLPILRRNSPVGTQGEVFSVVGATILRLCRSSPTLR